MALGGVATGNMKAKDELSVQGIMMYSGLRPMERDWGKTQKGAKCPFDLQFLTWDFSRDAVAGKGFILR